MGRQQTLLYVTHDPDISASLILILLTASDLFMLCLVCVCTYRSHAYSIAVSQTCIYSTLQENPQDFCIFSKTLTICKCWCRRDFVDKFSSRTWMLTTKCQLLCKHRFWEALCSRYKVSVTKASHCSRCPEGKKGLCCHQETEAAVESWISVCAAVHHQHHQSLLVCWSVLLCSYLLCSFCFPQALPCLVWMAW